MLNIEGSPASMHRVESLSCLLIYISTLPRASTPPRMLSASQLRRSTAGSAAVKLRVKGMMLYRKQIFFLHPTRVVSGGSQHAPPL